MGSMSTFGRPKLTNELADIDAVQISAEGRNVVQVYLKTIAALRHDESLVRLSLDIVMSRQRQPWPHTRLRAMALMCAPGS